MTQRLITLRAVVVLICIVVLARLFQLQIIEGRHNRRLADENRIRIVRRLASRGNIYDRNGRLLAGSRPAFSVSVVPAEIEVVGRDDPAKALAELLDIPHEDIRRALDTPDTSSHDAVTLVRDASPRVVAQLEEHSLYLSGVTLLADAVRDYPCGNLAAHVLGYVREINSDELALPENAGYRPLDLIGKAGVEKTSESILCGIDGGDQIEVDARGRRVRTLGTKAPSAGNSIRLTLDLDLQRAAEEALENRPGSVVVLNPWTGEVLALANSPSYDPNVFIGSISPDDWDRISGPNHPQHNRATTAQYPPGSLFKIITAAAALESGSVNTSEWFNCRGIYRIGSWGLRCWKRDGHGEVSFTQGFAKSCNVMFATLGRRVGAERLAEMAKQFGLGAQTGIDLPEEASGLVPTPEWKQSKRNKPWYPGDTPQMAVGQGDCLVTPIQIARQISVVANGGMLVQPHVLLTTDGDRGQTNSNSRPVGLRPSTIAALRAGMESVVAPGGTAASIATDRYPIAGKTGTAQVTGGDPHAWFAGYAPSDRPQLVVVVVVEYGGSGSEIAAPIARHIFDTALLAPEKRPKWRRLDNSLRPGTHG